MQYPAYFACLGKSKLSCGLLCAGCSFEIWAECLSSDPLPAQAWVQQQPPDGERRIVPIKSGHLTSGHLDLQVYVQR